jgi:hypothetical protein
MHAACSQADANTAAKFWAAVAAEFLGTFLFAFFGGAASPLVAAWANGIGLAVLGEGGMLRLCTQLLPALWMSHLGWAPKPARFAQSGQFQQAVAVGWDPQLVCTEVALPLGPSLQHTTWLVSFHLPTTHSTCMHHLYVPSYTHRLPLLLCHVLVRLQCMSPPT